MNEAYKQGFDACLYKAEAMDKLALQVDDRLPFSERLVSATLGRMSSPLMAAVLGTSAPFREAATMEDPKIRKLVARFKRDKELSDVQLSLGSTRPIEQLKRTWTNKNTWLPTKVMGTLAWPSSMMGAAMRRGDYYDPFANTAVVYNKEPAIIAHELGHAKDFKQKGAPGAYMVGRTLPPLMLYQEYTASRNAAEGMNTQKGSDRIKLKNMERLNRILGGGMGSYVAGASYILADQMAARKGRRLPTIMSPDSLENVFKHLPAKGSIAAKILRFLKLPNDKYQLAHGITATIYVLLGALTGQLVAKRTLMFGGRKLRRKVEKQDKKKDNKMNMHKKGFMDKLTQYNISGIDSELLFKRMHKTAGPTSEMLGTMFNPLNLYGGNVIGPATAAFTETKTPKEQALTEDATASNILVPGVAPYRFMKRMGRSAANAGNAGYGSVAMDMLGGLPAAVIASIVDAASGNVAASSVTGTAGLAGLLLAALTKRRSLEEQAKLDKSIPHNLTKLIPGFAGYNLFKRIGSTKAYDRTRKITDPKKKSII